MARTGLRLLLLIVFILFIIPPPPATGGDCTFSADEEAFLRTSLEVWERVSREALELPAMPLPRLVLFNESCIWDVAAGSDVAGSRGAGHSGMITLPGGDQMPAQIVAFASEYGDEPRPYLVLALPSVWRAEERHREDPALESLVRAVMVHELTHTRQTTAVNRMIRSLQDRGLLGDEIDDDVVQKSFAESPGYRERYEAERDLMFAIASEPDLAKRRSMLRTAATLMRTRRAAFFAGDKSRFSELEDLFLNMEGTANWAALRAVELEGLSREEAVRTIRRGGRYWSQDQGLALFLALDAVSPSWKKRVFSDSFSSLPRLLDEISAVTE